MYYVYELVITPCEKVCYVGKGKNLRMYAHRKNMTNRSFSQSGLYRRLRQLIADGKDFYPRKVFESAYEEECLKEEHRRIMEYGFDNLFNSTSIPGRRENDVTDALRQAMSKAQKEKSERNRQLHGTGLPPEHCAAIGRAHKGFKKPQISIKLKLAYADGRMHNDGSAFRNLNKSRIGVHLSSGHKAALSMAQIGKHSGPHANNRARKNRRLGDLGFVGVAHRKERKTYWARVYDCVGKKMITLGKYSTLQDAAIAHDDAFDQLYGTRPNGTSQRQSFIFLKTVREKSLEKYSTYAK